jgi:hypothetical protein
MPKDISYILTVNLHETDHLEEVLEMLAEEYVRDCVVFDAEGIQSRHGESLPKFIFFREGISNLLESKRNLNVIIQAAVSATHRESVAKRLSSVTEGDRWAASFWFIPIEGYFYHKGDSQL